MDKVVIGVPAYGGQTPTWWKPLTIQANQLSDEGIELLDVLDASSMAVDYNRNNITRRFLEEYPEADWLFWIDADNPIVIGALRRLLDTHKPIVSGLYVKGVGDPHPIAYLQRPDGLYESLAAWIPGELVRVDAVGLGCCLTHRSVYEAYDDAYVCLQRADGGIIAVHEDDIEGDIFDSDSAPTDGKVVDGQYRQRVYYPFDGAALPFFSLEHNRTEDIGFFERVRRLGFEVWLDTSIEVAHEKMGARKPKEYFEWMRKTRRKS